MIGLCNMYNILHILHIPSGICACPEINYKPKYQLHPVHEPEPRRVAPMTMWELRYPLSDESLTAEGTWLCAGMKTATFA